MFVFDMTFMQEQSGLNLTFFILCYSPLLSLYTAIFKEAQIFQELCHGLALSILSSFSKRWF